MKKVIKEYKNFGEGIKAASQVFTDLDAALVCHSEGTYHSGWEITGRKEDLSKISQLEARKRLSYVHLMAQDGAARYQGFEFKTSMGEGSSFVKCQHGSVEWHYDPDKKVYVFCMESYLL